MFLNRQTFGLAVLLVIAFAGIAVGAQAASVVEATERLGIAIDREHRAGRFNGVVVVGHGDAIVYRRAVGDADRDDKRPHRTDEPWRLASVSKQIAALLVMQQVERDRLTLDTTLDVLLPDFESPSAARITVRNLLQHTSGLPNPDESLPAGAPTDSTPPYYLSRSRDDAAPVQTALEYCSGPTSTTPGERFSYNNCDTLLIQAVLERLTGQPYAKLLEDAISRPLRLDSLALVTPTHPRATPMGYLDAERPEPAFELANFGASGAVVGSAEDLWRFDQALMQHRLLGDAETRVMWTGDPKLGYVALGAWSFPARLAGCKEQVMLVERRGEIGGVQVRNLMAPILSAALIVLSNTAETEFGEIWQGKGWLYELASASFCLPPAAAN